MAKRRRKSRRGSRAKLHAKCKVGKRTRLKIQKRCWKTHGKGKGKFKARVRRVGACVHRAIAKLKRKAAAA